MIILRINNSTILFKKQNQYNSGEILIKPKKGMCLIFPSWLEHNTMPNQNETEKRFSISFNIFPEGNLGYPNFLNHLKVWVKLKYFQRF